MGMYDADEWAPPPTAARVDIAVNNNTTWQDAFQFDPTGSTGCPSPINWPCGATGPAWTLTGMNFQMDIKTNINASGPADTYTSSAGQIVIQDPNSRIISTNVPPARIQQNLPPSTYIYNFLMFDNSNPAVYTLLMYGKFIVKPGV